MLLRCSELETFAASLRVARVLRSERDARCIVTSVLSRQLHRVCVQGFRALVDEWVARDVPRCVVCFSSD
ncbi:hypothetical protein PSAB6_30051 [Paraburkholderia sabiae]|nr:hypothetical protein PSAB6_30051 [Paraburkholderia sabiae]